MLQKATLISRDTKDGWGMIFEDVPLGKLYWVDLETITTMKHANSEHPGVIVDRTVIQIFNPITGENEGWMPLELLKIEVQA